MTLIQDNPQLSYQDFASQMAQQYGIPENLFLWQIGTESGWNPNAKNPNSSASGIAQFTKGTAAHFGLDPFDPYASLEAAAQYMAQLKQRTGSWINALSAYGTTHDNPEKQAQAKAILDGTKNLYLESNPDDNSPKAFVKRMMNTGTENNDNVNSKSWIDSLGDSLTGVFIAILGVALILLAISNTGYGKRAIQIVIDKANIK